MYYVYLLQSTVNKHYYIGFSDDVAKRLREHNAEKTRSTKAYIPYVLIGTQPFATKTEARRFEIHLKKNYQARKNFIETFN